MEGGKSKIDREARGVANISFEGANPVRNVQIC